MKPDPKAVVVKAGGAEARVLSEQGKQYAIYLSRLREDRGADGKGTGRFSDPAAGKTALLELDLPAGDYAGEWVNPRSGEALPRKVERGGKVTIESPPFEQDLALRLVAVGG
jgi:hypothetical protein